MEKKEKLEFDFPEMEFTDEELNKKEKNIEIIEEVMEMKSMVEDVKSAMESGKESGEILSEKTNIEGSRVSEIYKGMGMAAGLTIGVGKAAKSMSDKLKEKISDKIFPDIQVPFIHIENRRKSIHIPDRHSVFIMCNLIVLDI